jgi:hypothetical protein
VSPHTPFLAFIAVWLAGVVLIAFAAAVIIPRASHR